jgi:acetyl esterase/lipase
MQPALAPLPPDTRSLLNQAYVPGAQAGHHPDSIQALDLFVPAGPGPFPLILWIHGGGWHSCGRQPEGTELALKFIPHGFALAAIGYRLTPDAPFPAQIEDCGHALAWLRRHAAAHRLDPNRVGVIGHSAGAHLCALLATGTVGAGFAETGAGPIQAAVCWSPPFDLDRERGPWLVSMFAWNPEDKFTKTFFPGGTYDAAFARRASPSSYLHAGLPPLLVVHGALDTVIPFAPVENFVQRARSAGADVTFRLDAKLGHNTMNEESKEEALQFFVRTLRPVPAEGT